MALNNKGQAALVGIMVSLVVVIFAFQLLTPLRDMASTVRGATGLDCDNTSISTGSKLTCIGVDLSLPVFAWCALFAAFTYLVGKRVEYQYQPPQQ